MLARSAGQDRIGQDRTGRREEASVANSVLDRSATGKSCRNPCYAPLSCVVQIDRHTAVSSAMPCRAHAMTTRPRVRRRTMDRVIDGNLTCAMWNGRFAKQRRTTVSGTFSIVAVIERTDRFRSKDRRCPPPLIGPSVVQTRRSIAKARAQLRTCQRDGVVLTFFCVFDIAGEIAKGHNTYA